jgi:hypothetical protein
VVDARNTPIAPAVTRYAAITGTRSVRLRKAANRQIAPARINQIVVSAADPRKSSVTSPPATQTPSTTSAATTGTTAS